MSDQIITIDEDGNVQHPSKCDCGLPGCTEAMPEITEADLGSIWDAQFVGLGTPQIESIKAAIAAVVARHLALAAAPEIADFVPTWTADPPTKPGLYWFALIDSDGTRRHCVVIEAGPMVNVVFENLQPGDLYVFTGEKPTKVDGMHRVWAGPLLAPAGEAAFHEEGQEHEQHADS